jgi:hypothetical protein
MDSVEVITQQRHVAQVRAVEHVANPAHERNRTDGEIDTDIANHAQERPGRHAETSRLPDQVGRHAFRGQHPNGWDQVQQRVGAEAELVPGTQMALSRNRASVSSRVRVSVARKEVPLRGDA